ncbi:MAG: S9 family peptidase [Acidobacteriota bacterium]
MKKITILILILAIPLLISGDGRNLKFEDMFKAGRLSALKISPNGENAIFSAKIPNLKNNNFKTDVYMVNLKDKKLKKITLLKGNYTSPEFLTDNVISYLSARDGDNQLYSFNLKSGKEKIVSDIKGGIDGYSWLPGKRSFVFLKEIFPCKKNIKESLAMDEAIEKNGVEVKVLKSLMYRVWNYWKNGKRSHVFLFKGKEKEALDLTPGNFDTPPLDLGGKQDYTFSPDGKIFAYVKNVDKMVAISTNNDIFLKDMESGTEKNITLEKKGSDVNPAFSPDGNSIAYISMEREGFEADKHNITLYNVKSGKKNILTSDFKFSVKEFIFSPNGKYIYFNAYESIYVPLYRIRLKTGKIEKLASKVYVSDLNITPDGRKIIFLNQTITYPKEVFQLSIKGKKLSKVTTFNDQIFKNVIMNPIETFTFKGAKGDMVEGALIKPPFFDKTKKYPMVFLIHGGPQGAWGDDFHFRWNMSLFSSPGYIVAAINFHGSVGYGQDFTDAVTKDWGGAPFVDLIKGQEYLVKNFPYIDENKIVAAGASYGGFMINWIAGNYERFTYPFQCLVSHDGIFDSRSMYYSTEELWFEEWEYGGTPWNSDLYEKFNPSRFVEKFKIPMLIIHGEKDFRVPVSQGIMLFTAYQRRGIKSKMLYYPNEDHFVKKPKNAQFWWKSVLGWFAEHIKTQ